MNSMKLKNNIYFDIALEIINIDEEILKNLMQFNFLFKFFIKFTCKSIILIVISIGKLKDIHLY